MDTKLILLPTDGSESARKAQEYAIELAVSTKARLLVLFVQQQHGRERVPPDLEEFERVENIYMTEADLLRGAAETIAARTAEIARKSGVSNVEKVIAEGDPTQEIIATARARKVDTIVIGSRGLGDFQGLMLGSVSHKVAQMAPCTCIIVR